MAKNLVQVTDASFESQVLRAEGPVLVDFWAPWCGPCRAIAPALESLAAEYGDTLKVAKLDVDENPLTAARYDVRGLPTVILFRSGAEIERVLGAVPRGRLAKLVEKGLS